MSSWRVTLLSDSRCSSNGRLDPHPSYACFTNCMDPSVGYSGVNDCDEDYSQYDLLCRKYTCTISCSYTHLRSELGMTHSKMAQLDASHASVKTADRYG